MCVHMPTRAIQHIPAHLSFGAVTCNSDNQPASVVNECCRLNCPLCHRNRRVPYPLTLSCHEVNHFMHERCFGACGSIGPVPLLQALSHSHLDPLAGFLRSRFLDAWRAFMTPGTLGLTFHDFAPDHQVPLAPPAHQLQLHFAASAPFGPVARSRASQRSSHACFQ